MFNDNFRIYVDIYVYYSYINHAKWIKAKCLSKVPQKASHVICSEDFQLNSWPNCTEMAFPAVPMIHRCFEKSMSPKN